MPKASTGPLWLLALYAFPGVNATAAADFIPVPAKTMSTFYGPETRSIVQANIEKYEWARAKRDQAVADAAPWVSRSDEELWRAIPSPVIPRAIGVNQNLGCPGCGKAVYGDAGPNLYAFEATPGTPWKIRCPNCKELFPKNDFAKFLASGMSEEDGLFHYELADRSLLFNGEHPDPGDPKHTWCVDDGRGWRDPTAGGNAIHLFVACHNYRGTWAGAMKGLRALAEAHALTGEAKYARKCLVMMDRLADVYPQLNGRDGQIINFAPGNFWDGIIGPNYWEGGAWASLAFSYNMIYDVMPELTEALAFIHGQSERCTVPGDKSSVESIRRHIEQRLFVDRFHKRPSYQMNGSISEMCEAKVDLVLRGQQAIDEFASLHMPRIVPPQFLNEDGSGNERSIGYDLGAFSNYEQLLVELAGMDMKLARKAIRDYPRFRAVFDFWPDIWCIDAYLPNIGDTWSGPGVPHRLPCTPGPYLKLFEMTGERRYAQVAWLSVKGDTSKWPRDIWSPDPEAAFGRAEQAATSAGPWSTPSLVKTDYRLGILRTREGENKLALWLFYSPHPGTSSHSHFDALNMGLFAFGRSVICEQGYPLFTGGWPSRWQWTSHTRSHATVTVNGQCQKHADGGTLLGFAGRNGVQMISAEAAAAYDGVSRYRRTLVLVEACAGRHFIVDVFRVRSGQPGGGEQSHVYTLPVYYADPAYEGPALQEVGDIYEGYVEDVKAASADEPWRVDWAVRDGWAGQVAGHLRAHGTASDATIMLGKGETRIGNDRPERLPYLFLKRTGSGELDSTFVVLYEPYREHPFLPDRPLRANAEDGHIDVRIRMGDDRRYELIVHDAANDPARIDVRHVDGSNTTAFELTGQAGPCSGRTLQAEVKRTVTLPYWLREPAHYDPSSGQTYPLLVFLHGAGERGTDLEKIRRLGPLSYADRDPNFPFIVLAPQCPLQHDWSPDEIDLLIDEVIANHPVDEDRIYLTGFSMGGSGTWETAMDYPDRFAAIAPLCGRVIPLLSGNLWRMPTWVFHGDADEVVPFAPSREMVNILRGMGNEEVHFTVYEGRGHDIWTETYNNPRLYRWLLDHRRSERE